ncbi:hypothetical protein Tco_1120211 [Tanacetum coccineum]
MLLTRLFKLVKNENHDLYNESYVLYDHVMNPLATQQERKTRKDRGTRRGRHSTSSSAFDQPSSSHLNDDDDDGNGEGTLAIVKVPGTETTLSFTKERTYDDLTNKEKVHEAYDIRATNIILQGLPPDVFSLVNHHTIAKEMWDRVKLLIEVSKGHALNKLYGRMFPEESDEVEKYVGGLSDMIQGSPFKRQNVARAYTVGPGEKKVYEGSKPLCPKCNYHHDGQCAPKYTKCKRTGHLAQDSRRQAAAANNQRAPGAN